MQNIVITIGREFGSGGRYIGEKVAKELEIPFYDKKIITETYEKSGCHYGKLNQYDEVKKNSFLKGLDMFSYGGVDAAFDDMTIARLVNETIVSLAERGSCVILGRNSNNILKGRSNVINIFIYSNDLEFKVKRKMELENLSYDETLAKLKQVDKKRKQYYEAANKKHYWGDRKDYDYLIDSSILGVDKTAELIVDLYKKCSEK